MLGKTSAQCRFSLAVASFEAKKKAEFDTRSVPVELQELFATWWKAFCSQNMLQTGQLEPWKEAIVGQNSELFRCSLAVASLAARKKAEFDTGIVLVELQKLFCTW